MKYTQLIMTDNPNGKTVKKITRDYVNESMAIIFTDNTFLYITSSTDYDGAAELIHTASCSDISEQYQLELITLDEKKEAHEIQKAEEIKEAEKRERKVYEKLRAKFEVNP